MTLRWITRLSVAILSIVALLAAVGMMWTTTYLHRLTTLIEENVESVQAGGEIELNLVKHARSTNLAGLTGRPLYAERAARAEDEVQRWKDLASQYVSTAEEAAALADLGGRVDQYLSEQRRLIAAGLSPTEVYLQVEPVLDAARDAAKSVRTINVAQATERQEKAAFWDRMSNVAGAVVIVLLFVGVFGVILALDRLVYRPLVDIRGAIDRFAGSDLSSRANERGPAELRQIAAIFNRMAETVQRHRQQQLSFLAGVAHDLRNPLGAIKMSVATVAQGGGDAERTRFVLGVVGRQVDLLTRMISDLLDATRIEAGHLEIRPDDIDLREVARHSANLFRPLSPRHEIALDTPRVPVTIHADPLRIEQVVNNLLSNAIKYSPDGGRIELQVTEGGSVSVSDRGIGIPADEQAWLFEPFRRGATSRETVPGVGLGLAVARRIVAAHGGRIEVRSSPGEGSTFTVHLGPPAAAHLPTTMPAAEPPVAQIS